MGGGGLFQLSWSKIREHAELCYFLMLDLILPNSYLCFKMYGLAAPPPVSLPAAKPPAALVFNGKNFMVRGFDKLPKQFRLV